MPCSQSCIHCSGIAPGAGNAGTLPGHHIWQLLGKQKRCQSSAPEPPRAGEFWVTPAAGIQQLLLPSRVGAVTTPTLIHSPSFSIPVTRETSLTHCLTCTSVIFTALSTSLAGRNKRFVLELQQTPNLLASPTHWYCNLNWNQHEAPRTTKQLIRVRNWKNNE